MCREAFRFFVDEFKTYGSVLSQIKTEYETRFLDQRATIEALLPYKSKLSILEYESNHRHSSLQKEYLDVKDNLKQRIFLLEAENEKLSKELASEKEANINLGEEVLKFESYNVREEFLNNKIKEMRSAHQREELSRQKENDDLRFENMALSEKLQEAVREKEQLKMKVDELKVEAKGMVDAMLLENCQKVLDDSIKKIELETGKNQNLDQKILALEKQLSECVKKIKQLRDDRFPNWDAIQARLPQLDISIFSVKCRGNDFNDSIMTVLRDYFKAKQQANEAPKNDPIADAKPVKASAPEKPDKKGLNKQAFFVGLGISLDVPLVSF